MAGDNTLNFTDNAFDQDVLNSEVPVLVDFWAPWCGPCRAMAPTVDAVADEYLGKIKVGKLNTDDNPGTASRYQIRGIPTLLLFKGGKVVTSASAPWASRISRRWSTRTSASLPKVDYACGRGRLFPSAFVRTNFWTRFPEPTSPVYKFP